MQRWFTHLGVFIFTVVLVLSARSRAVAYANFIGYGYSSCLTCHVNGSGSGPLNDYGRGVWSGELASRLLYPSSMSNDDIAAQSGFLGKVELPYWLRPHIKYRGIDLHTSPGSVSKDNERYYHMQFDAGLTVQDSDAKYVGVMTFGRVVSPANYAQGSPIDRILAREYYLRAEVIKSWWIYGGLMEKVYGIRNIDHTSYQREYQGFNVTNNDVNGIAQSHGVVIQHIAKGWELSFNYFLGNPYDDQQYKASGFAGMAEFEVAENKRLGFSALSSTSDVLKKQMTSVHYRHQLAQGSSLMTEMGLIQDQLTGQEQTTGSYFFLESLILLTRGVNFKATVERYNQKFDPAVPDQWKWSAGFLIFPAPRFEWRFEAVNARQFSNKGAYDDQWALESQIHVSL